MTQMMIMTIKKEEKEVEMVIENQEAEMAIENQEAEMVTKKMVMDHLFQVETNTFK